MDLQIRLATPADLADINEIYNHYVLNSTCTYQTEPESMEGRKAWFAAHGPLHPVTVACEKGRIVGWASLSRFHPRTAYGRTVENSVYVRHGLHRQGIGRALLAESLDRARAAAHHTVVALISADQAASLALHAKMGFTQVAHLHQVGYKFDRWLDVIFMQLML